MLRFIAILFCLSWCAEALHAQSAVTGVRLRAALNATSSGAAKVADREVGVFLQGDVIALRAAVAQAGGAVNTVAGDILTARVPLHAVGRLVESPALRRITLGTAVKRRNDRAATHVGVDLVHAGAAPLPQGYTGEGVIVGVIDSGIDWRHRDFRDRTDPNRSRVLAIWDQTDSEGRTPGFSYGTEWTQEDIEQDLRDASDLVRHTDLDGHGTHVIGTAASNGAATGSYKGMAPDADLIMVGLDFNSSTAVVDGVSYIFQKAEALGKPVVINASLGSHMVPHDGSSLDAQALDNLMGDTPGRFFVAAAGNEGSDFIHWGGFSASATPTWTYYAPHPDQAYDIGDAVSELEAGLYGVVQGALPSTVELRIGADSTGFGVADVDPMTVAAVAPGDWFTLQDAIDAGDDGVYVELLYRDFSVAGEAIVYASPLSDRLTEFFVEIYDRVDGANLLGDEPRIAQADLWRFMVRGRGQVHVWSEGTLSIPNPADLGLTPDDQFRAHDNAYTVGSPATGRNVFAVGAFTNVRNYVLGDGTPVNSRDQEGDLAPFSSMGPTLDGRLKPEIVAPGHNVISALSTGVGTPEPAVAGGVHFASSGTSMASPVVAGAVALYLQRFPEATPSQIREVLIATAKQDGFTSGQGPLPNQHWGHGKLDLFAALTTADSPVANEDLRELPEQVQLFANYPNPFNPTTTFRYALPEAQAVTLEVFNALGQRVRTLVDDAVQPAGRHRVSFDAGELSSGLYLYRLATTSETLTRTMLLLK